MSKEPVGPSFVTFLVRCGELVHLPVMTCSVVVVLEESIIVHNFSDLEAILTVPSAKNPRGRTAKEPASHRMLETHISL